MKEPYTTSDMLGVEKKEDLPHRPKYCPVCERWAKINGWLDKEDV